MSPTILMRTLLDSFVHSSCQNSMDVIHPRSLCWFLSIINTFHSVRIYSNYNLRRHRKTQSNRWVMSRINVFPLSTPPASHRIYGSPFACQWVEGLQANQHRGAPHENGPAAAESEPCRTQTRLSGWERKTHWKCVCCSHQGTTTTTEWHSTRAPERQHINGPHPVDIWNAKTFCIHSHRVLIGKSTKNLNPGIALKMLFLSGKQLIDRRSSAITKSKFICFHFGTKRLFKTRKSTLTESSIHRLLQKLYLFPSTVSIPRRPINIQWFYCRNTVNGHFPLRNSGIAAIPWICNI